MASREERVVRNEDRFRQTNEGIEHLTPESARTFQIFCECADPNCLRLIEIEHATYHEVRSHSLRFMVAEGHQLPEFETVVSETDGILIVQKHPGAAADTARDLDPRLNDPT
jgi:hypothetical protein